MTTTQSTALLTLALSVLSARAMAANPGVGHTLAPLPAVTVSFKDLDTSTAAGAMVLYSRIDSAVSKVCQSNSDWYPTSRWSSKDCYDATISHIVAKLNLARLTAIYAQKSHRGAAATLALHADNR